MVAELSGGHAERLHVILELVRVEQADDPSAFRVGVQEYLLRCDDGAHANATLVWDDALLQTLAAARAPGCDPALLQELGERLHRFLEPGRFAAAADRISRALEEHRPVLVEVVASAGELFALPWELVTVGRRHLGECPGVEVRHRWPGAHAAAPARPPAQEGGRLLVAWSRGGDPLGEQFTIDAIAAAARAGGLSFEPARDVVPDASLPAIVRAIEAAVAAGDPPVALHLLCHGAPVGGGYGLRLSDGRGGAEVVDSRTLRGALAAFAGHLRLVALVACDSGNPGALGARLGSVATELHCAGIAAVVAARYPVSGAAALAFTAALYSHMFEGSCSIEQAFQAARERLVRDGERAWSTFQLHSHAGPGPGARPFVVRPYRGLLPFERQHAALFFGRELEVAEALGDLEALIAAHRPRLLAIAGASGTGKSSLALSVVRVALEGRGYHVAVMRPGRAPADALAEALQGRPEGRPAALLVDQFEEVFTHVVDRGRLADATQFVRALWALAIRADDPLAVILTIRVDHVGRCGELTLDDLGARLDRIVYDEAHRVFVAQMSPHSLRAVIERPAQRVGLEIEPGLPERLLREVAGESNALPLLEYVLDELWLRRDKGTLTHAALDAVGGVTGALARHADAAVDALDAGARDQAERLLVRLVRFGSEAATGTRRREDEAELRSRSAPEAWDRAAQALIAARLIVRRDEADRTVTLEIAHEAIIRHWTRLWRWYEAARDRLARRGELADLLAQYKQHGPLSGKALGFGQQLVAGLDADDVPPGALEMLAASADLLRRQQRTRRAWIGAALATLSVFLVVTTWLYVQADRSASRSRNAQRLAAAERFIAGRPHLAAALLRAVDQTDLFGWRQAAFSTLQSPLPTVATLPAGDPTAVAFAADGSLFLGTGDGALAVYGPGKDPPRTLPGAGKIAALAPSQDGRNLFVLRDDKLELWGKLGDTWAHRSDVAVSAPERLYVGARTGRVVTRRGGELQVWSPTGDRLEPVRARAGCLLVEPRTEQFLCSDGDDFVSVETWSGEQLGRHESPGVGRATGAIGGVSAYPTDARFAAWSWSGDGPTLVRREIEHPDQTYGIDALVLLPDRSVFEVKRDYFGFKPGLLCTVALDGKGQICVPQPVGCDLVGLRGRDVLVTCDGTAELRAVETLSVAQTHAGPRGSFLRDQDGRFALIDRDDRTLWRWDDLAAPAGLVVLGRDWDRNESGGSPRLPMLQPHHDRVVSAVWENNPSRAVFTAYTLRPGALAGPIPTATAEVPLVALDDTFSETVFHGDSVLVHVRPASGPSRLLVGRVDADRITIRTVRARLRDTDTLRAITRDGDRAFFEREGKLIALDLRGDEAHEQTLPGDFPGHFVGSVDPTGRVLELWALQGDGQQLVDIATGQPLRLPEDVRLNGVVAWAPEGGTFAIGPKSGPVTLARAEPDGAVRRLATLPGPGARVLAFAADGRALVVGATDGSLVLWTDLDAERPRSLTVDVPEPLWHLGLSRDGAELRALSDAGELRYWTLFGDEAALRRELDVRAKYCLSAREWTELADVPESDAEAVARDACAR